MKHNRFKRVFDQLKQLLSSQLLEQNLATWRFCPATHNHTPDYERSTELTQDRLAYVLAGIPRLYRPGQNGPAAAFRRGRGGRGSQLPGIAPPAKGFRQTDTRYFIN